MLTVFWDANGVAHSWFVLSGTTVNSEWCCETVGKLEVGPHMTVFDSAQVRDKLHTFDALVSPSWIAHHLGLTWCRQSFISFTKWRNILQDITTGRTMKSRQRLSCGYVIKIRSSVVTDLTEIPEIWQKRVGRPSNSVEEWVCGGEQSSTRKLPVLILLKLEWRFPYEKLQSITCQHIHSPSVKTTWDALNLSTFPKLYFD